MTVRRLEDFGFGWRSFLATPYWLGLLYRSPSQFDEQAERLSRWRRNAAGLTLLLFGLVWALPVILLSQVLVFGVLGLEPLGDIVTLVGPFRFHFYSITLGISLAIALGIAASITLGIAFGIAWAITWAVAGGIIGGIAGDIAGDIAGSIAGTMVGGIALGTAWGIAAGIATSVAGGIALGIAGGIALGIAACIAVGIAGAIALGMVLDFGRFDPLGIAFAIALGIATVLTATRSYYLLLHPCFIWPRLHPEWYPRHPVAWDDLCGVPFPGLDRLLAAHAERDPEAGMREIARLIDTYKTQRWSALKARARVVARTAGRSADLTRIDAAVAALPDGDQGFLLQTPDIRQKVGTIAALQRRLDAVGSQPFLRAPLAGQLRAEIIAFREQVAGFREPLASEFRAAAAHWLVVAERQLAAISAIAGKPASPQVFRAGDPVRRDQEAFVERVAVVGDLRQQIVLGDRCPALILYGRRRVGKSTVLANLDGLLPSVAVANLSMQSAQAFTSTAHFCAAVAGAAATALGDPPPDSPPADLPALEAFLKDCDRQLVDGNRRLIIALDEYNQIDVKIGQGVFTPDLLALIRDSIQFHRRLTWMFAGSHAITELPHAPWTSYLISAQTIEVPAFTLAETRLLLTEPLRHSPLFDQEGSQRPAFPADFWGEGGIERVQAETAGWPHLVQLVAGQCVDLVNASEQSRVDAALLGRALDQAVVRGDSVFFELLQRECTVPAEWDYLTGFRRAEAQPPPEDDAVYRSLRRRQLIAEGGELWRLRAPLMRRWLIQRG